MDVHLRAHAFCFHRASCCARQWDLQPGKVPTVEDIVTYGNGHAAASGFCICDLLYNRFAGVNVQKADI